MEMTPEVVKPILDSANNAVKSLKKSVVELEQFSHRLNFDKEVQVIDIETKLLVDDFFDPENHEIAPPDFKSYDVMQNAKNQEFLKSVFRNPPSILPVQNLGEIAFIL